MTFGGTASDESGPFYFVYLTLASGDIHSAGGFTCGIDYEGGRMDGDANHRGVDVFEWRPSGDRAQYSEEPAWPQPGSSLRIVWDGCRRGDFIPGGYFYLGAYGPDILRVTARSDGAPAVAGWCTGHEVPLGPASLGTVIFSPDFSLMGCNPCDRRCDVAPVVETTWGGVKRLFAR